MGQYFYFTNITTGQSNNFGSSWNGGLLWVKGLSQFYNTDEVRAIFEEIIDLNSWKHTDEIKALGDYGDLVIYTRVG